MADWISWQGGPAPADDEVLIDVRWGDGAIYERQPASTWHWGIPVTEENQNEAGVIVAYRLCMEDSNG